MSYFQQYEDRIKRLLEQRSITRKTDREDNDVDKKDKRARTTSYSTINFIDEDQGEEEDDDRVPLIQSANTTVYPHYLNEEDLDILNTSTSQYNDAVINAYADYLQIRLLSSFGYDVNPKIRRREKIVCEKIDIVFTTFMYETIVKDHEQALRFCSSYIRNIDLAKARSLVFPINLDNLHWVVIVVRKNVMTYYDSFVAASSGDKAITPTASRCFLRIDKFLQFALKDKYVNLKYEMYGHKFPQADCYNCGVYVCHRMMMAMLDRLDEELIEISSFRTYIKTTLT